MASITWGAEVAEVYDTTYAAMFEPSVLDPITGLLAELARGGPVLEFAVETGRVALALSAQGIEVHGLELSRRGMAQDPPPGGGRGEDPPAARSERASGRGGKNARVLASSGRLDAALSYAALVRDLDQASGRPAGARVRPMMKSQGCWAGGRPQRRGARRPSSG